MDKSLQSKAIDAALNCQWTDAVCYNEQILKNDPDNIEALSRLGRAYLELKHDRKASEAFRKVLTLDSLNLVAKKNLEILKSGNAFGACQRNDAEGSFIMEPGTTKKVLVHLDSRHVNPKKLVPGQKFTLRIKSNQVILFDLANRQIGSVCETDLPSFVVARKVFNLKCLDATFLNVSQGPMVEMLARASEPVFKGERQDINPEARIQIDAETTE